MTTITIINGPNLNLLGKREPEVYGFETLDDIQKNLENLAKQKNAKTLFFQSNHEGEIIDFIQKQNDNSKIILNPAGLTHTSIVLRDALLAKKAQVIEVHLSNIYKREDFRKTSYISDIAIGVVSGLGSKGYEFALNYFLKD